MSDSVQPQRWQPTRLFCPWDSPGKNTGEGYHFLLQCMRVKSESEVAQSCPTSRSHGLQPTRLFHPWDFPSKNTGVGCHGKYPSYNCPREFWGVLKVLGGLNLGFPAQDGWGSAHKANQYMQSPITLVVHPFWQILHKSVFM